MSRDLAKLEQWFAGLSKEEKARATKEATEKSRLDSATRSSLESGALGDTTEDEAVSFLKTRH